MRGGGVDKASSNPLCLSMMLFCLAWQTIRYIFVYQFGSTSAAIFVVVVVVVGFIVVAVVVICCRLFTICWCILFPLPRVTEWNYLVLIECVCTADDFGCMTRNVAVDCFRRTMFFFSFLITHFLVFYCYGVTWCVWFCCRCRCCFCFCSRCYCCWSSDSGF